MFKNILLGVGGSTVIGGIGYGIYSFSQSGEKKNTTGNGNSVDSKSSLAGQGEDAVQPEEKAAETEKNEIGQGGKGNGNTTDSSSITTTRDSSSKAEISPGGGGTNS